MAIIAVPMVIGAQFTAKRIMVLVAGEEFAPSGQALNILIFAAGIIFLGCMLAHGVIALDKQKKIIIAYIFTAVTSVAGYLIFIPRYSYIGAAWVTLYSELAIAAASLYIVWKYSGFLPNLNTLAKSLLASALMALFIYSTQNLNLIIVLFLSAIIYFLALYLLKGIAKEDISSLINK